MPTITPRSGATPAGGPRQGPDGIPDVALRAIHRARAAGFPMPTQPLNERGDPLNPQLPPDITGLGSEQLGKLFGEFEAVIGYAEAQVAIADIAYTEAKVEADKTEAIVGLNVEGRNKDERTWEITIDPRNTKAQREMREARAYKVLMEHLLRRLDGHKAALSREMTRRQDEAGPR